MGNIFIRDLKDYKIDMSPVQQYIKQATLYVHKTVGLSLEDAEKMVRKQIKKSDIVNPEVKYNYRNDNGDVTVEQTSLMHYIEDNVRSNHIVVPSMTAYVHPSKDKSLHAEFLERNIASRNADKKKAFQYKQEGNSVLHGRFNTLQKSKKIANNSLSGAYASISTILYNPSAHYSLTSTTRTATSIANAVTESMVAGNKHYREPYIVLNYIVSTVQTVNYDSINNIINKYNIYKPTAEEVLTAIRRSSDLYWTNDLYFDKILELLNSLDGVERAMVLYVNDFYNLRVFNDGLVRGMISKLSKRVKGLTDNPLEVLNNSEEFVLNLIHHICAPDIKGKKVNYKDMVGSEELDYLGSTALNVNLTLEMYSDLLQAFFRNDVMPVSVAYIRDIVRRVTVLSDTDSTCATYQEWVEWYLGEILFSEEATAVSASVMSVVTQVLEHKLRQYTSNLNVPDNLKGKITYKGEFYWHTMTPMSVAKHYFASVAIQEGNVFANDDLELKGVNLIASNAPMFVQKITKDTIIEINETINRNEKLSLMKYIKIAADLERRLLKELAEGNTEVLKMGKLKEASGYKLGPDKSPYINHILWDTVLSDKYGKIDEPPYTTVKVPTTLKTKRLLNNFLDNMEDQVLKNKFLDFCAKYDKDSIGTFHLPMVIIGEHGIPEDLIPAIDSDRIVFDSLGALYMVLSGIGFYKKEGMKLIDMGY